MAKRKTKKMKRQQAARRALRQMWWDTEGIALVVRAKMVGVRPSTIEVYLSWNVYERVTCKEMLIREIEAVEAGLPESYGAQTGRWLSPNYILTNDLMKGPQP